MLLPVAPSEAAELVFSVVVAGLAGLAGHGIVRGRAGGKKWMVVTGWLFLAPYIYVFSKVVVSQGAKYPMQSAIVLLGPLAVVAALNGPAMWREKRASNTHVASAGDASAVHGLDGNREIVDVGGGDATGPGGGRVGAGGSHAQSSDTAGEVGTGGDPGSRIEQLKRLLDMQAITQDEYESKKRELLGRM